MPGGGSKKGERRGGRQKGTQNVKTVLKQETLDRLKIQGNDPVDFLLNVMLHPEVPLSMKIDAAKAAAPYRQPRLQNVLHAGDSEKPVSVIAQLLDQIDGRTRGIPNVKKLTAE